MRTIGYDEESCTKNVPRYLKSVNSLKKFLKSVNGHLGLHRAQVIMKVNGEILFNAHLNVLLCIK